MDHPRPVALVDGGENVKAALLLKTCTRALQSALPLLMLATLELNGRSQTVSGIPAPAIRTPPSPALSFGTSSSSLNPAGVTSGSVETNLSIAALSGQIARFQNDLEQLLPLLNAFNNSFDFITTGSAFPSTSASNPGGAANSGANLAANLGSNLGSNLGANVSVPAGESLAGNAATNALGFPPGLGVAPITGETLRALIVLQSDLERLRPTLDSLNGSTNNFIGIGLTPGFVPGSITNVFNVTSPRP